MQITLNIDDDVFETARRVAERQSRPVASVISEMARLGMANDKAAALEHIRQIQEEMDEEEVRRANDFSAGRQPPDRARR